MASAILIATTISACASGRSADLLASAQNYEARSLAALEKLRSGILRETELPTVPDSEAEKRFADEILASTSTIDEDAMEEALHPGAVSVPSAATLADNFAEMRKLHSDFTLAFANVERAGLLGKGPVARCAPPVIDQMVARQIFLARTLDVAVPLRLQARRGLLLSKLNQTRRSALADAEKRKQVVEHRRAWLALEADERSMNAETIAALALAAQTGLLLRKQTQDYGKISLDEIRLLGGNLLTLADEATSKDLSLLRGKVDGVFLAINADTDFSGAADVLLDLAQDRPVSDSGFEQCLASGKGQ